jgi:microcystin-dependent protein
MKKTFLIVFMLVSMSAFSQGQEGFIGEVKLFAGNFTPRGWMLCQGQTLPISQYTALFAVLGTNYGGDGRSNFNLPDLRGKVPIGVGTDSENNISVRVGVKGGSIPINKGTETKTTPTLGLNYIICVYGTFPSRE